MPREATAQVPAIAGTVELLALDEPPIAGGTRRNREWVEEFATFEESVDEALRWLLCDAMTSGGLLVSAPNDRAAGHWARIGSVSDGGTPGAIRVR